MIDLDAIRERAEAADNTRWRADVLALVGRIQELEATDAADWNRLDAAEARAVKAEAELRNETAALKFSQQYHRQEIDRREKAEAELEGLREVAKRDYLKLRDALDVLEKIADLKPETASTHPVDVAANTHRAVHAAREFLGGNDA